MPAWRTARHAVVSTPANITTLVKQDMPFVLIDIRKTDRANEGFIQGAMNIPSRIFDLSLGYFPDDRRAPIILYGDARDMEDVKELAVIATRAGFRNVTALQGGYEQFATANPHLIKKGNIRLVRAKIPFIARLRPGEISIEDFRKIAEARPADVVILDVREYDETAAGMLKGAINVPASVLADRLAELPRDKRIVIHCVTGVRAEMAHHTLRGAGGFNSQFLLANVKVTKDGKYEISPR